MTGRAIDRGRRICIGLMLGAATLMLPLFSSCGNKKAPPRTGPIRIVVSIAPLKGMADEVIRDIAKDATVDLLVPVGAMEHGYEIPPSMISKLVNADVVIYVGLGLEPQVEKILKEQPMEGRREVCFADVVGIKADDHAHDHGHADHDHGHDHDHSGGGGADPHLWLDPSLVAKLAPKIGGAVAGTARDRGFDDAPERVINAAMRVVEQAGNLDAAYEERLRP